MFYRMGLFVVSAACLTACQLASSDRISSGRESPIVRRGPVAMQQMGRDRAIFNEDDMTVQETIWVLDAKAWRSDGAKALYAQLRPWVTVLGPDDGSTAGEQMMADPPVDRQQAKFDARPRAEDDAVNVRLARHEVAGDARMDLLRTMWGLQDEGLARLETLITYTIQMGAPVRARQSGSYADPPGDKADWALVYTIGADKLLGDRLGIRSVVVIGARDATGTPATKSWAETFVGDQERTFIYGAHPNLPTEEELDSETSWPSVLIVRTVSPPKASLRTPGREDGGMYHEPFDAPPRPWEGDGLAARWCEEGLDWHRKNGCEAPGSILIQPGAVDDTRVWFHFGAGMAKAVRIRFNYAQWAGHPPFVPTTGHLEYKLLKHDDFVCPNTGYIPAKDLTETWDGQPACTSAVFELPVDDNVAAVSFRFRKNDPKEGMGIVMMIDDVVIERIPADDDEGN